MDSTRIDLYCERLSPDLLAEPLNAVTNFAFFAAAFAAYRFQTECRVRSVWGMVLCGLVAIVGVSSLLFHTLATRWAGALDGLSILLFVGVYVFIFSRHVLRQSFFAALLWVGAIPLAMRVFQHVLSAAGGVSGGGYVGFLLIAAALAVAARGQARSYLRRAATLFAVSFTLRSLDQPLCDIFPAGTHLFWHLCNAAVLYHCILAYLCGINPSPIVSRKPG